MKRLGRSKSVSGRSFIEDCKDRNITKRRRLRWLRRAGIALSAIRGGDPGVWALPQGSCSRYNVNAEAVVT